jgi:integrase
VCKFIAVAIATCSRSARIYEASYDAEVGHPWVDLEEKIFYRAAQDENVPANKRAPPIPLGERILAAMKRWHAKGDRYVVEWAGKPANCKRAFAQTVLRARKQNPDLFKRPDGTPKEVVRHTLRHTGITWLALAGVDPYEICKFAGLSMEVFERVYSHHHPAYMRGVMKAQRKGNKLVAAE